jgi:hypothetical protein
LLLLPFARSAPAPCRGGARPNGDGGGGAGGWHYPCSPTGGSSADLDAAAPYLNPAAELAAFDSGPRPDAGAAPGAGAAPNGKGSGDGAAPDKPAAATAVAVKASAGAATGATATVAGAAAAAAPAAAAAAGSGAAGADAARPGVYKCAAVYPSADVSMRLGRKNLHLFR